MEARGNITAADMRLPRYEDEETRSSCVSEMLLGMKAEKEMFSKQSHMMPLSQTNKKQNKIYDWLNRDLFIVIKKKLCRSPVIHRFSLSGKLNFYFLFF